jgi:hypothetical protein
MGDNKQRLVGHDWEKTRNAFGKESCNTKLVWQLSYNAPCIYAIGSEAAVTRGPTTRYLPSLIRLPAATQSVTHSGLTTYLSFFTPLNCRDVTICVAFDAVCL